MKNKAWLNGHSENWWWSTVLKVYCILCVIVTVVFLTWQWRGQSKTELVSHRGHQLATYNFVTTLTVNNWQSHWWIHSMCVWNTPMQAARIGDCSHWTQQKIYWNINTINKIQESYYTLVRRLGYMKCRENCVHISWCLITRTLDRVL